MPSTNHDINNPLISDQTYDNIYRTFWFLFVSNLSISPSETFLGDFFPIYFYGSKKNGIYFFLKDERNKRSMVDQVCLEMSQVVDELRRYWVFLKNIIGNR